MTIDLRRQIKLAIMQWVPASGDAGRLADAILEAINSSPTHMLMEIDAKLKCPHCGVEGKLVPEYYATPPPSRK